MLNVIFLDLYCPFSFSATLRLDGLLNVIGKYTYLFFDKFDCLVVMNWSFFSAKLTFLN